MALKIPYEAKVTSMYIHSFLIGLTNILFWSEIERRKRNHSDHHTKLQTFASIQRQVDAFFFFCRKCLTIQLKRLKELGYHFRQDFF